MDKIFIDIKGKVEEYSQDLDKGRRAGFPVCIAIKYGDNVSHVCPDFILNINKPEVFVETDSPLPLDSNVLIHFYIPPQEKLLGEFQGRVKAINCNNPSYPKGMQIEFIHYNKSDLHRLEDYLEEKQRLVDVRT